MKNRNVGFLIIGISVVIAILVLVFNLGLRNIVEQTCTHGSTCPMYSSISTETWISLAIAGLVFAIGLFLVFAKEHERIVVKKFKEKRKLDLEGLEHDEKKVINLLLKENGAIFQSTLMETLGIGKVGITRLLDKLEAKQLIERKRRGMNNIIVLKN
jgi:uncharacterized membrane protein